MALEAHLQALQKKHQELEDAITAALSAPSVDDLRIADLKKKKLFLKDEISKVAVQVG